MPVHPSSIVDPGAVVSPDATIWHFSHIQAGAEIGAGVMIGQSVYVGRGVHIGARTRIQNFSNIVEGVCLEEDVFVGPHVTFTNVKYPRVAHPARGNYLKTRVERGATLGAGATILPGLRLGRFCFVAAGAVVTKDVPAFALVKGNPAKFAGWMSEAGAKLERLDGFWVCPKTRQRYVEDNGVLCEAPPL
ncbi:MAG: hypothetical protein B6A08_05820 [Sorangiineae bacterium NIC37A_2]|jgi:UDP-2-acetamido-3-amino-2,3-dideoxy-glucuronate N-acetyltransferase|nr:MAG: hypothetical protein B6A08_05820 [Sorangiineae bacterium NIC37A_2]